MNWIDIIFAIPLAWAAWKGWNKGLIVEVSAFLGLMLGVYFSIAFSDTFAAWLQTKYDFSYYFAIILAFIITFVLVVIGIYFLAKLVEGLAASIALTVPNKIGGSVFSILKYMMIISVILSVFAFFHADKLLFPQEKRDESLLYKPVSKIAPYLIPKIKKLQIPQKIEQVAGKADSTINSVKR